MARERICIPFADRDEVALEGYWLTDQAGNVVGLHLHHPYDELVSGRWPKCGGGGYIAWVAADGLFARHALTSGGPDKPLSELTLSPSLWHRAKDQQDPTCPQHSDGSRCSPHRECHGFIRNGRWAVA